jgi:hypothetical protein
MVGEKISQRQAKEVRNKKRRRMYQLQLSPFVYTTLNYPHTRGPFFAFPSYPTHHCPFTPVVPGHGVDLFEDDYLFLLRAADLRMDPALRPRPVSSLTSVTLHNSTTLKAHRGIYYLHVEQFVFVFVFVFCGLGRSGEVLIIINGTI